MGAIREYRPEDLPQIAACLVALYDFLHGLEPQVLAGRAAMLVC